ncbi:MAG: FmdB family zinc ribbon protein [Chloroflexota bacterium]|nr:hypothetical protein [Anaerolineae bacterium]
MPTYQYKCDTCGIEFERKQHFTDKPLEECPECDGRVHRVIQPVLVVFKGSGFYVTDNRKSSSSTLTSTRSNGTKEAQGSEGTKESKEEKESSPKTDSNLVEHSSED